MKYNKNMFIKKNIFVFYVMFLYGLNSFAMFPTLRNLNREQHSNYLNNSIDAFLNIKAKSSILNNIFSPIGMHASFVSLRHILNNKLTKCLEDQFNKKGIVSENIPFLVDDKILHFFTVVLTRDNIVAEASNKLQSLDIQLIENIGFEDKNNLNKQSENKKNQHEYFDKNQIDFLRINSIVNFENNLQLGGFKFIGAKSFTTSDKRHIEVDFIEKIFYKAIQLEHKKTKWKAVRLLCTEKYSIDIIIPKKKEHYKNDEIKQILVELITSLNYDNVMGCSEKTIILQIPKIEFKQKNDLTVFSLKNYFSDISFNYNGFLVDNAHNFFPTITQEAYIGLYAESNSTVQDNNDSLLSVHEKFVVNETYFFVINEFEPFKKYKTICDFKNIIMIGEVGDPSQ